MQQRHIIQWGVMIGLISAAVLLTLYFHGVLGISTVFTHLFYIPIILGALWWGAPGILIAVFLAGLLMVSHLFYIQGIGIEDYSRAGMFLLVSGIVVALRRKIRSTEANLYKQSQELEYRVRALSCLYGINSLRENAALALDDILTETVQLLVFALKNGAIVTVHIRHQNKQFDSGAKGLAGSSVKSVITVSGISDGEIEVHWSTAAPPDEVVLTNAQQLIDSVAHRLAKVIEHENARLELNQYRMHLEELVRERTEDLIESNRRMQLEAIEREMAQQALGASENRYRILFENATEAIFVARNGQVIFPNPALSDLTGYTTDDLLKHSFEKWIYENDRDMVLSRHRQRLSGVQVPHAYAFRIINRAGGVSWVEINTVVIQWQGEPATLNFLRDITSRKKIEATMGQIRKLEAVGVLAGGIAHQFNNALSIITGNIDLLKLSLPVCPDMQRYIGAIIQSVRTMTGLTQQLLAYARGGKYQSQRYSLTILVKDVLLQLTGLSEKKIDIEFAFAPQTPMVEVDTVQMRMVMLAVLENAVDAIETHGRIRIDTNRVHLDQNGAEAFNGLPVGIYAGLSISDNGKGMPEKVRKRIFEPFFSTKFLGRGMGMASAYGIVKNHGGYIYVDSVSGQGTTVHILLPPSSEDVPVQPTETVQSAHLLPG